MRRSLCMLLVLLACSASPAAGQEQAPIRYVDPFIGTGIATTESARRHSEASNEAKGQTFPAVGRPFGMVQWTPQTQASERKCLSPYYYGDDRIQGFRGSRWMSGSCTQDYGSVTLMPMTGTLQVDPEARASRFTHASEVATPAYYAVDLDRYGIRAEMTAAARAGLLRFTFASDDSAFVVVEPNSDEGEGYVEVRPEQRMIVGYNPAHRIYQGWGEPAGFSGHFAVVFDRPFAAYGIWEGDEIRRGARQAQGEGGPVGAWVRFDAAPGTVVHARVGTSLTSTAQAEANLAAEIPGWSFGAVRAASEAAWNELLGRVEIEGGSEAERTMFYTALYHALLLPRLFSDADGSYVGFAEDDRVHKAEGFDYYADFSAWDTYRAVHPLLTLVAPERARDMVRSLILKAEQGGWLPIFPSWNNYTAAMIGDHAATIIADAYLKGIRGFDAEKAYRYMVRNATEVPGREEYVDGKGRRALPSYLRYGYIPMEDSVREAFHQQEQVSRTLEYAYDDFVLAEMARVLGHEEDYRRFRARAANYRNVFDPAVGFVRGRHADGRWAEGFQADRRQPYITEGYPWHYTWYVPHDVQGLIELMGGRAAFVAKLDSLFELGLNWHGNEPTHQIAYLYNWAGAPWKAQQRVREIMDAEYGTGPGGLSGNDDAGQMSAWYAFGAMGFYPVTPGVPYYALGSPIFERITLHLGDEPFTIRAEGASDRNRYIQSATLDGAPFEQPWIAHETIRAGGTLVLRMGPEPNPAWGSAPEAAPPSMTPPPNTLTEAERAAGWQLLFDGRTTEGWRGIYREGFPERGWAVEDGALTVLADPDHGGAVITENRYGSFELVLEFKMEEATNSGIKYFVQEREPATPGRGLGLEYQIWDDDHPRESDMQLAALYDLIPAEGKPLRPVGAWNEARIVVDGDHVEHWLNGQKVVEFEKGSPAYRRLIAESKYRDIEGFAEGPEGHILLQDEGAHRVWFRNIKIREL